MTEKIKLNTPIKVDGVLIHELTLRKPKVKDLIVARRKNTSDIDQEITLIANLAEIPHEAVEDLDLSDYLNLQNWLKNFLFPATPAN